MTSELASFQLIDGILYVDYFVQAYPINEEKAECILRERLEFQRGRAYPVLIRAPGHFTILKEARDFFMEARGFEGIKAIGILLTSDWVRAPAEVLAPPERRGSDLPVPVRMFNRQDRAVQWLSKFKV
jgi:hypothetical protein